MSENINKLYNCPMEKFIKSKLYVALRRYFLHSFKVAILSEEFKKQIYSSVEENFRQLENHNKTFREVLPKGFENSLKVLAYNKAPEVVATIKEYIKQEKFKAKVKNEINKFISSLNPMVAKFVNADSIYNKIMNSILTNIDNTENTMNIVTLLSEKIDEFTDSSVNQVTSYIPYEGKISLVNKIVDSILSTISDNISSEEFYESIEVKLRSYNTLGEFMEQLGLEEADFMEIIL